MDTPHRGNDSLRGLGGDDHLTGGDHNDFLDGGGGNTITNGGPDVDKCVNGLRFSCEL